MQLPCALRLASFLLPDFHETFFVSIDSGPTSSFDAYEALWASFCDHMTLLPPANCTDLVEPSADALIEATEQFWLTKEVPTVPPLLII
ncbi:hypothetical protein ACHAWF_010067 [Thalassiosira exigua]